jgi:hypothetical protein
VRLNAPLQLQVRVSGRGDDLKVISVLIEKIVLCEKLAPIPGSDNYLVYDRRGTFAFLGHDELCRLGNVMCRAHGGVSGSDDRHSMCAIRRVKLAAA